MESFEKKEDLFHRICSIAIHSITEFFFHLIITTENCFLIKF